MACERIKAAITESIGRRAADQGGARSLQSDGLDRAREVQHVKDDAVADRSRGTAMSTRSFCDSEWEASLPRRRGPSARPLLCQEPGPRFEVPYCTAPTPQQYLPISSSGSMTATGTTTS